MTPGTMLVLACVGVLAGFVAGSWWGTVIGARRGLEAAGDLVRDEAIWALLHPSRPAAPRLFQLADTLSGRAPGAAAAHAPPAAAAERGS